MSKKHKLKKIKKRVKTMQRLLVEMRQLSTLNPQTMEIVLGDLHGMRSHLQRIDSDLKDLKALLQESKSPSNP